MRLAQLAALVVSTACAVCACGAKQPTSRGTAPVLSALVPITASGGATVNAVALGAGGEIFIAGEFAGTLSVGDSRVSASGGRDGFVARLGPGGVGVAWLRRIGGLGDDRIASIATGPDNAIALGGEITGRVSVEAIEVIGAGRPDGVVGVMASDGNLEWLASLGATRYASVTGVAFTERGEIALTGYFAEQLTLLDRPIYSGGGLDILVARFRRAGGLVWIVRGGGPGADVGRAIVSMPGDALAITGSVMDGAELGGIAVELESPASDLFIAELDGNGRFRWVSASGGEENDAGAALALSDGALIGGGKSVPALVRAGAGGGLESATPLPDIATVSALAADRQLFAARQVANPNGVGGGVAITAGLLVGKTRTVNLDSSRAVNATSMAARGGAVLVGGSFLGDLSGERLRVVGSAKPSGFVALWSWP